MKKDILFVIDNINYRGGAHIAAERQIEFLLECGHAVDIFSTDAPNEETKRRFAGCGFIIHPDRRRTTIYATSLQEVLQGLQFSLSDKILKLWMSFLIRLQGPHAAFRQTIGGGGLTELASGYRCVAVVTENSVFRSAVSQCRAPLKYQWVHTDYAAMRQSRCSCRRDTKNDGMYWSAFTKIIFISENARSGFFSVFPHFAREKTMVLHNLLPMEPLAPYRKKTFVVHSPLALLTVARLDYEKNIGRSLRIAAALKKQGVRFLWRFVGDGSELCRLRRQASALELTDCVQFVGYSDTPWFYAAESDLFVLNSRFEGIPNVIFESLYVGLPVVSTVIAAIPEQIQDGINGRLLPDDDEKIIEALRNFSIHPELILQYEKNLLAYTYDNAEIREILRQLFSL